MLTYVSRLYFCINLPVKKGNRSSNPMCVGNNASGCRDRDRDHIVMTSSHLSRMEQRTGQDAGVGMCN